MLWKGTAKGDEHLKQKLSWQPMNVDLIFVKIVFIWVIPFGQRHPRSAPNRGSHKSVGEAQPWMAGKSAQDESA
jgi:hypothetical protein